MFHHRWHSEVDRRATALVLARSFLPHDDSAAVEALAKQVRERMVGRVHFTGSSEANAPLISRYLDDLLAILEAHLESRKYLFGARPAFADFGLAPQLYEAALDPTAGRHRPGARAEGAGLELPCAGAAQRGTRSRAGTA